MFEGLLDNNFDFNNDVYYIDSPEVLKNHFKIFLPIIM